MSSPRSRVRLRLNLGTADARRLGLEPASATDGAIVEVTPADADAMTRRGWAEAVETPAPPTELKAVPPVEVRAEPEPPAEPQAPPPSAPRPAPNHRRKKPGRR